MSYVVVHMQKINAGAIRGIQSHINREHEPHTNPDVDPARTPENYALVESRNFYRDVQHIIRTHAPKTKTVRKDAVLACNFIVTSDHGFFQQLPPDRQRAFFQDAVDWFANRYGKNLILSAVVHMDETTPHLHLSLVPIKGGRLAAKNLFTKSELRELQTAFAKDVGATYGLQRGLEGSNRGHLTELQFKIRSSEKALERASERVSELVKETSVQEAMASEAEKRLSKARNEAAGVNTEYLAKRAYLAACDASSAVSVMYPDYAVVKKSLFGKETVTVPKEKWEQRWVAAQQREYLQKATARFEGAVKDYRESRAVSHVDSLEEKIRTLTQENRDLELEVFDLQKQVGGLQKDLQRKEEEMLSIFQQAVDFLPDDLYAQVAENYNRLSDPEETEELLQMMDDFGPEL